MASARIRHKKFKKCVAAMYSSRSTHILKYSVLATEFTHFGNFIVAGPSYYHPLIRRCICTYSSNRYANRVVVSPATYQPEVLQDVKDDSTGDRSTDIKHSYKMKVFPKQKLLSISSSLSKEGPVVHDAHASAVVDLRSADPRVKDAPDTKKKDIELWFQIDQLLKDARQSIRKTSDLKPYEDIEYAEEQKDNKFKTKLVGSLTPDALDWQSQKIDIAKLGSYYASLSKSRLTGLVVLTAMAGYAMAPCTLDPFGLVFCSVGTGLTSAAANSINQFFEVPYDSQMDRTKNRILVRGILTPLHAVCFGTISGTLGVTMLYYGVNGFAASLGALNLILYTSVYTPMKRMSIVNTWVGSIVGAIPPLIGWVGCSGELETGAWIMAAILYSWQFPHFNALSWNLRADYSRAGYRMMSVTNPALCQRVALRHSFGMIAICSSAPLLDVTTWTFFVDSMPFNCYLAYLAWRFYKDGDSKSSRKLFMFSLIHLPAVMMLMIISKKHYSKKDDGELSENSKSSIAELLDKIPVGTVR